MCGIVTLKIFVEGIFMHWGLVKVRFRVGWDMLWRGTHDGHIFRILDYYGVVWRGVVYRGVIIYVWVVNLIMVRTWLREPCRCGNWRVRRRIIVGALVLACLCLGWRAYRGRLGHVVVPRFRVSLLSYCWGCWGRVVGE